MGQFLSPDTIVPDPTNLFDYNRYMYVRGNAMNAVDPSGHFCVPVVNMGTTCQGSTDWDAVQSSLDATGIVDPTPISDGANAVISVVRGNYVDAGLSAVAIVPILGDLAKGGKYLDEAAAGARWVGDKADEGWQAAKRWTDCLINSFSAKTLVMTPAGLKAISELVEGELVLAYNEATGEIGAYPIVDTISHVDPEIVLLTIDGETLETTAEHPFYELESAPWLAVGQTEGRWTDALDLQVGDLVWKADGTSGVVQSVEVAPVQQRMYNLTVALAHTFFVGDGQWLVHNGGPCGAKGLIDKDFEGWLSKNLGGSGSFSVGGREFDGAIGNRWYEAKSGQFWDMLQNNSKEYNKFLSDMGSRLKIAQNNNATYELHSNTAIPQHIKDWLTNRGIQHFEHLE